MPAALHHLALGARDVAALAAFYRDAVGLPEVARHFHESGGALRSVWLRLGGGILMVEEALEERDRVRGQAPGWFLVALAAPEPERAAIRERLAQAGTAAESATAWTEYFRDPEGNRFALSAYPLPE